MDASIFSFLNSFVGKSFFLDLIITFSAKWLPYFLILVFLVYYGVKLYKNKLTYAQALLSVISAIVARGIVKEVIVFFYSRPRPIEILKINQLIGDVESGGSFPSGHAIFFFALSTVIYKQNKKAGLLFFAASLLIALARISAGLHWPSDILGGATLGILVGLFTWKIYESKFRKA